jgi:hypothetical protein
VLELVSDNGGRTHIEIILEQGAEENSLTEKGRNDRRLERTVD